MPLDPARVAETREWLQKAAQDLRGVRIDLEANPPLLEDALFHCQQSVEKAIKGFLSWHDVRFGKTHSLEELSAAAERVDPSLKARLDPTVPLTEYAWAFRYPGDTSVPSAADVHAAFRTARQAVAAVISRLPGEAVPDPLLEQLT